MVKYLFENYFIRFSSYLALGGVLVAGGLLAASDGVLRFVLWSTKLGFALKWAFAPFHRKINASKPRAKRRDARFSPSYENDYEEEPIASPARRRAVSHPATSERRNAPDPFRAPAPFRATDPFRAPRPVAPEISTRRPTPNDPSPRRPEHSNPDPRRDRVELAVPSINVAPPANAVLSINVAPSTNAAPSDAASEPPKRSLLSQAFGLGAKKREPEPTDFADDFEAPPKPPRPARREYVYPSIDFLAAPERYDLDALHDAILERGAELERVCASFGVELKVVDAQPGPVLTLYEIELKKGLRVNKLNVLTDDLAIAMKTPRVRVVSPIPGKNTVGIEIPNQSRQLVRLREVMEECAS
ncbi:MAG: hypothetical protein IIW01_05140, partial [Thermoguttaceae bacterium]|nr:hypothetical protein [Thermoguttaceae bacterium]